METKVHIVIHDGVVETVLSTDPDVSVEITELDSDYATRSDIDAFYEGLVNDETLVDCNYMHRTIGEE